MKTIPKILGIIPARGGSKGVPNKNIKKLNGKPLIQYTSEIALKSKYLNRVIVSTDDANIAEISKLVGVEVPFMRPDNLAQDTSPTLPVIKHALNFYKNLGIEFDAVCLLQVTSPIRTLDFLNNCLGKFIESDLDSLISVLDVPHHLNPHWTFKENVHGNLSISTGEKNIISRRQDLPNAYYRDGSVYLTKTEVILNQNSLYGDKIGYFVNPTKDNVNIDTLEDWQNAEIIFRQKDEN
ncbi:acylneuraminate cytidylyltransferase family protein [Polaribacter pectinis]|uniref:Acylneuraminate cytidylyltransferase family protein n=1 Tax=Polaribacter pectinis TaxID=2738844 RepID=A0A7G9LAX2_9FLAO|nr:acylneuraminate cytidylyltransferase family protein [Polaribacter pectinis]QNM85771.1 acylneuraminate cytidylyltransferase family protein [Polaribacter pectinis]